jgi:hypothetical protein
VHVAIGAVAVLALAAGAWAVLGSGGGPPVARDRPAAAAPPPGPASAEPSAGPTTSPTPSPTPSRSPTPKPTPSPTKSAGPARSFAISFYGAADNTPPGSRAIAYGTVHSQAGGTGTYRDPITFATDRTEVPVGTVIYYAPLRRYFVMEDDCTDCDREWQRARSPHIDLWAGTATDDGIVRCENSLTRDGQQQVLVNPPPNLPVSPGQLYDNGRCVKLQ